ncbi:ABC transporter permease [Lutispora saccharofermentans]|uniref:ABC transporter permease n=1 Tax=Lutispora saccharofermentans TaxID=3024236 RepID=A0ABT1NH71_9FIRM|nr:ABC transporter permease subunit [Lutispora saccharofermentans]MCQ1530612.1 ABC transporter permease [Lutispora saccharofermentans]
MKINPVLHKEMKIRMRGWRAAGMIGVYLIFLALTASFVMIIARQDYYRSTIDSELAMGSYIGLAIMQFVLISFIAPALTTGAISGEREKQTLDLLLCTRMTPFSIVIGKLFASISQIILLIVASLPIFSIVFLFGGISFKELLELFGFFIIIAITFGSIGIFYSCYFKRTTAANVLAYGTIAFLYFGTIFLTLMYLSAIQDFDYKGVFPLLYSNPIVGFASLLWSQFRGGSLDFLPGFSIGSQGAGSYVSPWLINLIFNIVLSISLLLLSANKINPLKSKFKTKGRINRANKQISKQANG